MFSCKQVPAVVLALLVSLLGGGTGVAFGAAPVVKGISPNNGSVTGGTQVTISGEGFIAGSTVKFGTSSAAAVTIESSKQIKATSPAGTGLVGVSVTNANGTSAATPYDQFGYDAAPTALWLGLNGNNATYLGSVPYWAEREVVYDRGGPVEFTAGELPKGGVETDVEDGMIPVVVIEYAGYGGEYKSDPEFPQKRTGKEIAEGKNTIKTYVHGFVKTALAVLQEAANKDPEAPVLLEPMNEPWGYTTPQYNGAEYAEVIAELLPEAQKAGIPLADIYVGAIGKKGWVPTMYKAQVKLETDIQGWYFHPYGSPSGTHEENSEGIQSMPYVQAEMTSGQNNIIVSEVGYCAKDVNEGKGCNGTEESVVAASNLTKMLGNAKPYHEQGWLKGLLVYSRNAGGWAMQTEPGVGTLTMQGKALDAFAEAQVGWSILETPKPEEGAKIAQLEGVSCSASNACFAVGVYWHGEGITAGFGERWNGTEWSLESGLTLPGATYSQLGGVACISIANCVAVGRSESKGSIKLVAEHWNGTKWQVHAVPKGPGESAEYLNDVSCSSANSCNAVGSYVTTKGINILATAESWDGNEWTFEPVPTDTHSIASLSGVSCTSSTACVAVGRSQNKALAEYWDGAEWQPQVVSQPLEAKTSELLGVSCVTSTACVAVGYYFANGADRMLAESWNGSQWRVEPTPTPLGAKTGHLASVSCSSKTKCVAVGYYTSRSKTEATVAESWNGVEWTVQPTPNPIGPKASYLDGGVSCPSTAACIAVGHSENSSKDWSTLAEAYL
jgi:hypothetical protein